MDASCEPDLGSSVAVISAPETAVRSIRRPLRSPLGTAFYDFDSCMTRCAAPFAMQEGRYCVERHRLVAHSVPYLLHACTNFGRFQAVVRRGIDRLVDLAADHVDARALANAVASARSRGRPLAFEDLANGEPAGSARDPLVPDFPTHFRSELRGRLLFHSSLYETSLSDARSHHMEVVGATLTDLDGREDWRGSHDSCHPENRDAESLLRAHARGTRSVIRYNGATRETITSRLLMQCYWALAEVVLLNKVDPTGTRSRLATFEAHACYAVVQFALFGLKVLANHYHALMLAPTILAIIELALDGPLPGCRDYGMPPDPWQLFDPPSRYHLLCASVSGTDSIVSLKDLHEHSIVAFKEKLLKSCALPFFYDTTSFGVPDLDDWIIDTMNRSAVTDRYAWYWLLSTATATRIRTSAGGITDHVLRYLVPEVPTDHLLHAPVVVDDDEVLMTFASFSPAIDGEEASVERLRTFLHVQAGGFLKDAFLFDPPGADARLLGVSDETLFGKWLAADRGDYERLNTPWFVGG